MSTTKEREPMLSDDKMRTGMIGLHDGVHETFVYDVMSPEEVRDYYESLITSGKLRVVEEVEHEVDHEWDINKGWKSYIACPAIGETITVKGSARPDYCPRCGSKIKR